MTCLISFIYSIHSLILIYKESFIYCSLFVLELLHNKNSIFLYFKSPPTYMWNHYFHFYLNLLLLLACGSSTGSSPASNHSDSWIKTPKSSSSVLMTPAKPLFFFVSNKTSWSKWIQPNNHTQKSLSWERFASKLGISEDTKPPEKLGEITSQTSTESFTWWMHQTTNVSNKAKFSCKEYCKCQSWKKCQLWF